MVTYTTTTQLAAVLNIKSDIPSWDIGASPSKEEIGTGDGVVLVFYLDHKNILASSYILYYGATEAAATTTLTETTHYTLNKDTGKITLTTTGRTLLSTNKIFGEYSYINVDVTDSYLATVIERAEKLVDGETNTTFTNGTAANPAYPSAIDTQKSKGSFNRNYFADRRPILILSTALASDLTAIATSLTVTTGDGTKFPTTGVLLIGSEMTTYTGITTNTFTGLTRGAYGSTAAAHLSGVDVRNIAMQVSATGPGSAVEWNTLQWDSEFYADEDEGQFHVYDSTILAEVYADNVVSPYQDIPNRVRLFHAYGWNSIPVDITRLTLIFAKQMLTQDTVTSSLFKGRNEFRPSMLDVDEKEKQIIIGNYSQISVSNT